MEFDESFRQLTGNSPFPWQESLYRRFAGEDPGGIPASCSLPTGLGKTSVVAIWLLALANKPDSIPRRLVYVVNRRTVVDQTTNEVVKYQAALESEPLQDVCKRLAALCAFPLESNDGEVASPLALSTLRGQLADNREWSTDPTRPAVIVGTVDMIGSRLLFSGYGVGLNGKPLHAGFLGQDVLLVHDEAHLEPGFQTLLTSIQREQQRCDEFGTFRVMELSATSRDQGPPFELTPSEQDCPDILSEIDTQPIHVAWRRQKATKVLKLVDVADEKQSAEKIAEIALNRGRDAAGKSLDVAVLVFVRRLDDVKAVLARLTDTKKRGVSDDKVRSLTGTMRGKERDEFTKTDPVFMRFLPEKSRDKNIVPTPDTVYLVCTSAGEVGVDISADHLVCDLSPFDSMAQRMGRVNRYGLRTDTRIDVVYPNEIGKKDKKSGEVKADALDISRQKTLALLKDLPQVDGDCFDASPLALGKLPQIARREAFTPQPTILPTTDILFDAWAMTSIREEMPGRPDVAPYLHGLADDAPQTSIAWRSELDLLEREPDAIPEDDRIRALNAIFDKHRVRPHETVTVSSGWLVKFLEEIAKKVPARQTTRVAILFSRRLVMTSIDELVEKKAGLLFSDATLIFPASLQCLCKGMLSVDALSDEPRDDVVQEPLDVADHAGYEREKECHPRARVIINRNDDGWYAEPLVPGSVPPTMPDEPFKTSTRLVNQLRGDGYRVRLVQPIAYDEEGNAVRCLVSLAPLIRKRPKEEQTLEQHVGEVQKYARLLADKLQLNQPFHEALLFAAKWHDEGKKAPIWQRFIGGPDENGLLLGKSAKWCDPKKLAGYRHEFGSVLRIEHERSQWHPTECVPPVDPDTRDLALHLIAAHHGHARPHYSNHFDKEFSSHECEATHIETIRRFARLQHKYGRWGLAYLESLLRAADAAASAGLETDDEMEDAIGGDA